MTAVDFRFRYHNIFRLLADYVSENWRGFFTESEKRTAISRWWIDFVESCKANEVKGTLVGLFAGLQEDVDNGSHIANLFIEQICSAITSYEGN